MERHWEGETWSGLIADDGKGITFSLWRNAAPQEPFILMLQREQEQSGGFRIRVQDLMGNGYGSYQSTRQGVGTALVNLAMEYLHTLPGAADTVISGELHDSSADPAGHHAVRRSFVERFGVFLGDRDAFTVRLGDTRAVRDHVSMDGPPANLSPAQFR